jgi:nicotinamidase-related amidase
MPRLPIDTVLLVLDAGQTGDQALPLLQAWRDARMPIVHVFSRDGGAACPPDETFVATDSASAFTGTELETWLEARGATTLVICGSSAAGNVAETVRDAVDLGYRVFATENIVSAAHAADIGVSGSPALIQAAMMARTIRDRYGR